MKPVVHIWKIGGKVLDDEKQLQAILTAFAKIDSLKILVHGGGQQASALSQQLGIESKMIAGRRLTDKDTLKVVTMVYAGLINKTLVARLQALEVNALGLSGADANIIKAEKREKKEIDYGFAGDIVGQDLADSTFSTFFDIGLVPVICPLTHNGQGQLLNTNADTIASYLGQLLCENYYVKLVYCFDKPGVLQDVDDAKSAIPQLNFEEYRELINAGSISSGMIPKLDNAFVALEEGVQEILLGDWQSITNLQPKGTKLCMR